MTEHFTRATVEASGWCARCGKPTMHRVDDRRIGPCLECNTAPTPGSGSEITKLAWRVKDWPAIWLDRLNERAGIIQFEAPETVPPCDCKMNPHHVACAQRVGAEKRAEQDIRSCFTQESELQNDLWSTHVPE